MLTKDHDIHENSDSSSDIGPISRPHIILQFAVSVVLAFAVLTEIYYGWIPEASERSLLLFLVATIFLNNTHNVMTYVTIFMLPELKANIADQPGFIKKLVWIHILIFAFFFLLITKTIDSQSINSGAALFYVLFFDLLLVTKHVIYQNKGISLQFDLEEEDSKRTTEDFKFWRKTEVRLFFFLFFLVVLTRFELISKTHPELRNHEWINSLLSSNATILQLLLATTTIFIFLPLIRHRKRIARRKAVFLSRILFWNFLPFSFLSTIAIRAFHGLEYASLYCRITQNSRISSTALRRVHMITILGMIAIIPLIFFRGGFGYTEAFFGSSAPFYIRLMATLYATLAFGHIYLDSQIFKMRDPKVRNSIGELLKSKKTN